MASHPEVIFKSNDLATLPEETLITLLENDELNMDEDDVWMSVVQWAIEQVPELGLGNNPDNWSYNNISMVKDIITDCIPHIRFFSISPKTFVLYEDLIPKKLRQDILNYHLDKNYKPQTPIRLPRIRIRQKYDVDSLIINNKQVAWISSKIVELMQQHETEDLPVYNLTLLYRQSRDGDTVAKFRKLCNYRGPTISVGKVLGTEEILGGYNPFAWGSQSNWVGTKGSFIFALDKNIGKSIVSFVCDDSIDSSYAICDYPDYFPSFGAGRDLFFGDGGDRKPYAKRRTYQLPITLSSDPFEWTDWEVFSVSNHRT